MNKNADAFRTISEVAEELELPQHVLRFWETRFVQIKPLKRAGGRRYYRPHDIELLRTIKHLLYQEGYTIRGVQRVLKETPSSILPALAGKTEEISSEPGLREPRDLQGSASSPIPAGIGAEDNEALSTQTMDQTVLPLMPEWTGQLRDVLAELTECVNILAVARRR